MKLLLKKDMLVNRYDSRIVSKSSCNCTFGGHCFIEVLSVLLISVETISHGFINENANVSAIQYYSLSTW